MRGGSIHSIHTAMTGETYALFRRHSVLGRLMPSEEPEFDAPAFDRGLRRSEDADGLLHQLFGIRTAGLLGSIAASAAPSFLSGLLTAAAERSLPAPLEVHPSAETVGDDTRARWNVSGADRRMPRIRGQRPASSVALLPPEPAPTWSTPSLCRTRGQAHPRCVHADRLRRKS